MRVGVKVRFTVGVKVRVIVKCGVRVRPVRVSVRDPRRVRVRVMMY